MTASPVALMRQPGTLTVRTFDGPPDAYNNPTATEATITFLGYFEQRSSDQAGQEGQVQRQRAKLVAPVTLPLDGWSKVKDEGTGFEFEVIGHPWKVFNPRTGAYSHIEADLEAST